MILVRKHKRVRRNKTYVVRSHGRRKGSKNSYKYKVSTPNPKEGVAGGTNIKLALRSQMEQDKIMERYLPHGPTANLVGTAVRNHPKTGRIRAAIMAKKAGFEKSHQGSGIRKPW